MRHLRVLRLLADEIFSAEHLFFSLRAHKQTARTLAVGGMPHAYFLGSIVVFTSAIVVSQRDVNRYFISCLLGFSRRSVEIAFFQSRARVRVCACVRVCVHVTFLLALRRNIEDTVGSGWVTAMRVLLGCFTIAFSRRA